ncbi:MAG: hypothetical protein IPP06_18705 [Saprospiraceae bacterium]|nr:hypothetical protein [Candidatus Vicinibacter affinis]
MVTDTSSGHQHNRYQSSSNTPGHDKFITSGASTIRLAQSSKTTHCGSIEKYINNPCPGGLQVPTTIQNGKQNG